MHSSHRQSHTSITFCARFSLTPYTVNLPGKSHFSKKYVIAYQFQMSTHNHMTCELDKYNNLYLYNRTLGCTHTRIPHHIHKRLELKSGSVNYRSQKVKDAVYLENHTHSTSLLPSSSYLVFLGGDKDVSEDLLRVLVLGIASHNGKQMLLPIRRAVQNLPDGVGHHHILTHVQTHLHYRFTNTTHTRTHAHSHTTHTTS